MRVLGRGAYSPLQPHQLNNFVWWHEKFVHPSHVLLHDNITLMGVTPTHAFFCVSDPGFDVYDTKVNVDRQIGFSCLSSGLPDGKI